MVASRESLLAALDAYIDPLIGSGLVACGAVQRAELAGDRAQIALRLGFPAAGYADQLANRVRETVRHALGIDSSVQVDWRIEAHAVQKNLKPLAQIRNIIAV